MDKPVYIPRFGSMADRVIEYFRSNPDEELSQADIAEKFDVPRSSVKACLDSAVAGGSLSYAQNEDLTYVYTLASRSSGLESTPKPARKPAPSPKPAASTKSGQPSKRGAVSLPPSALDFSSLKVESGIPLIGKSRSPQGESKWAPLFGMVGKPGLSVAFPVQWKSAVSAQATKLNAAAKKSNAPTHYIVRVVSGTEARLWRTT